MLAKQSQRMTASKTTFRMRCLPVIVLTLMFGFGQTAFAKEQECCWIDVKTGKRVPTVPDAGINHMGITGHEFRDFYGGGEAHDPGVAVLSADRKSARNSRTGQNYALEAWPPPGKAQPAPTPSTTDKVTDALRTIGSSVSIGIGGGGYSSGHKEHHHGEDRHRTADKVSTDKTKTHKTSPTTTHKTVTSACKCHPCTCSPCTCH